MPATKLTTKRVEKPWGRSRLGSGFADPLANEGPVGEIWFDDGAGDAAADLLIKYLFTSEKLSVQVHPDDGAAQSRGLPRGKDECWLVLAAEPGATIALGPRAPLSAQALRAAALDGSVEDLLDWRPVEAGDFIYAPAGTIHAIGAGLTVLEIQQYCDTTYRLYDYGRPRELHLDDAISVACLSPYRAPAVMPATADDGWQRLAAGQKFVVERHQSGDAGAAAVRHLTLPEGLTAWLVPLAGQGSADDVDWLAGECLALAGEVRLTAEAGADVMLAYAGAPLR